MRRLYLVAFLLLHAAAASAQAPADLTQVNIEDLMQTEVQRVFGASERLQPVTEAPSSVTIVTAADIERYGYRTLADILRSARGFFISNDRNYSQLGARGFARAGDYNTRVLLLINGHRFNDNVYDQASVGADFGVDVAMMERVEIIRGPASSLYGTSAFFAVVNVITRSGASINGVSVDLDAGTHGVAMARVSGGKRFANGADLAVSSTVEGSGGEPHLYLPAFDTPETNHGVADHLDGERIGHAYARLSAGNFAVTATFGRRLKDVPTASFATIFNEQISSERTSDQHLSVTTEYSRTFGATRLAVDTGVDRYDYKGRYPFAPVTEAYPVLINNDEALGVRWNAGARVSRTLPGRQTLTVGGVFYDNVRQNQWFSYNDASVRSENLLHSSRQSGIYVQDEIRVRPWLLLNGGVRYDQYEQFSRATPRAAVIVSPWTGASFKYLYGEAFRAPNAYELYYYGTTENLRPEFVRTNEVVWEQYFGERLRTSTSAYHYTASQLITFQELDSESFEGRYGFINDGVIDADGLELEAEFKTKRGLQALTSYVLQRARQAGTPLTNSPQHMFKSRVTVPVGPRAFASAEWQFTGTRSTLDGDAVGAVSVVNLSTGWPLTRMLSLTGSVANLFDQRYSDPGSDEHLPDAIPQIGRTMRVGVRWTMRMK